MTLTFFGGLPDAPRRVAVLPLPIENVPFPDHRAAWSELGNEFSTLPVICQRTWWWFALSMLSGAVSASSCIVRLSPTRRCADRSRQHWIDAIERIESDGDCIDGQMLLRWGAKFLGQTQAAWRTGGVRFGVAPDGVNDLCFCIDAEAVPQLITDWSAFLARHKRNPDATLIAFRQLVLIHPFRDGNGRLARMVAAHLSGLAGLPRLLMMPTLALFRARNDGDRVAYSRAFTSSDASVFSRFVLDRTAHCLSAIRLHTSRLELAVTDGLLPANPGSIPSLLNRRLLEWPVVSVEELASIGRCSSRNAYRWCETYAGSGGYSFDGSQLVWRSLLENLDQVEPEFWAAARASS